MKHIKHLIRAEKRVLKRLLKATKDMNIIQAVLTRLEQLEK